MSLKSCMHCGSTAMRRINRKGFFEEKLLPSLGIFPWECAMCRRKTYLRNDGHSDLKRKSKERRAEAAREVALQREQEGVDREHEVVERAGATADESSNKA